MSQYPTGYGQWSIDPSAYYPYPPATTQTQHQPPTAFAHPHTDATATASYAASQKSFGYNATQIPGLGFGGTSSTGSNLPTPQPSQNPWMPPPLPTLGHAHQKTPAATQISAPQPDPPAKMLASPPTPAPQLSTADSVEEGELTDEDFDDLYDPQPDEPTAKHPVISNAKQNGVSNPPKKSQNSGKPREARSRSYSPQLSLNDTSRRDTHSGHSRTVNLPGLGLQRAPETTQALPDKALQDQSPAVPVQFASAAEAKKEAQKSILRLLPLGVKYQTYIDEGFDEAIIKSLFLDLNLLPQTVAPKPTVPKAASPQNPATARNDTSDDGKAVAKDKTEERKDRIARLLAAKAANKTTAVLPTSDPAPPPAAPAASDAQAVPAPAPAPAPAAKLPTPTQPAAQNLPPASAPTAPAAERANAAVRSKADKEALLKKKLEALKERQRQAKISPMAGQAPSNQPPPAASGDQVSSLAPPLPLQRSGSETRNTNTPSSDLPVNGQLQENAKTSTTGPSAQHAPPSIPGLAFSVSNSGSGQPSSRKRPVAADFVDYTASAGPSKRPFGQYRQDSLVIDITDGSDEEDEEEDDVEMEVDSPGGHSASSSSRVQTPNRRGPSIKDFPPLSEPGSRKSLSRSNSTVPPAKLNKLDGEIQLMRARIAAMQAKKKKAVLDSRTPDIVAGLTELREPDQPLVSSFDGDTSDLASAQLISEAESANTPRASEPSQPVAPSKHGYGQLTSDAPRPKSYPITEADAAGDDRRTRITSLHLPKVEAKLLEKKTKLKLLEHKAAQLRLEIELEAAEKERLAEELRLLSEAGPATTETTSNDPKSPEAVETPAEADPIENPAEQRTQMDLETDQPVVDKAANTWSSPEDATGTKATTPEKQDEASQASSSCKAEQASAAVIPTEASTAPISPAGSTVETPTAVPAAVSAVSTPESGRTDDENRQPSQPLDETETISRNDELPVDTNPTRASEEQDVLESSHSSPEMEILSIVEHNDDEPKRASNGDDGQANTTQSEEWMPSFTPYESPLTYFRSYRFHPKFSETVNGGLKSLTYTNKINPKQALCPNELTQKKCTDEDCGFQHFKAMVPRDDQILMELGRADDFADGEEKNRFIAGLRDLLAECRSQKVRDLDQIGRAIIDYRRKFIGDQSRVLTSLQNTKI